MRLMAAIATVVLFGTMALVVAARSGSLERDGHLDLTAEAAHPDSRLEITGVVEGPGTATVVLRIDDRRSRDYASRVNLERVFVAGPLRWQTVLGGLVTPGGRPIEAAHLRKVMVFKARGSARVRIERIAIVPASPLPEGARGYAFGASDAQLPEGFERIAPGDARIEEGSPVAIRRPMPDPLAANGLQGVGRIRLAWPPGRAQVTIWAEDPGAWELLPHPLSRQVLVNGRTAFDEHFSPADWVRQRYLRGRDQEHADDDDAWTAYGRRRAAPRTVEVDVDAGGIVVALRGDAPHGRFLNAILVAPAGSTDARERVELDRARWYRDNWPVLKRDIGADDADVADLTLQNGRLTGTPALGLRMAPDTGARLRVRLVGLGRGARAEVAFHPPAGPEQHVRAFLWSAKQRLERRRAQDSYLTLADNMLVSAMSSGPAPGTASRLFEAWISASPGLPPGVHAASLLVVVDGERHVVPVRLDVLNVGLPPVAKPSGVYLDEMPHLTWFSELAPMRSAQVGCDLKFVRALGLTGSAPALSTPATQDAAFAADMRLATEAGLAAPVLAYAPAKRTMEALGPALGAARLATASRELVASGIVPPVWSIADEPSNPGEQREWMSALAALRAIGQPRPRVAGHLNSIGDRRIVGQFDVALVNAGFGLDADTISQAAATGAEIWLYNTERPRLAAGVWLWQTAARRYVQWHARMPTADPFDPLDGREGDEQLILPSAHVCPETPSIHRDLLELAEGVVDQRWLAWLETRTDRAARALRGQISRLSGKRWDGADRLGRHQLQAMRESIMRLASIEANNR
jgi:hypothetical protein